MFLEKLYKIFFPLGKLISPGIRMVKTGEAPYSREKRGKDWVLDPAVKPEDAGLTELAPGLWTGQGYCPQTEKGAVRDSSGRPVRLPFYVTEDELFSANVAPGNASAPPSFPKGIIPAPMRKLAEDEDLVQDGPMGGWYVVNLASRLESPDEEARRERKEILDLVRNIHAIVTEK